MKKKNEKTRVLVLSDLHCGAASGLTPPSYIGAYRGKDKKEIKKWQTEVWDWIIPSVQEDIASNGAYNALLCVGDLIDGSGHRSGGTELITTDKHVQTEIAVEAITELTAGCDLDKIVMVRGTPYHIGQAEQYEDLIAAELGGVIENDMFLDIHGVVFNMKHKVSTAQIAMQRARDNNLKNYAEGVEPLANILLRGHTHKHKYMGGSENGGDWLVAICPCLQGSTRYGSMQCTGHINVGYLTFDVYPDSSWSWTSHIADLGVNKKDVVKL